MENSVRNEEIWRKIGHKPDTTGCPKHKRKKINYSYRAPTARTCPIKRSNTCHVRGKEQEGEKRVNKRHHFRSGQEQRHIRLRNIQRSTSSGPLVVILGAGETLLLEQGPPPDR